MFFKIFLGLLTKLIGAEGTKTPAGDPAGALATRRLPGTPAESEVPGAEINWYITSNLLILSSTKIFLEDNQNATN